VVKFMVESERSAADDRRIDYSAYIFSFSGCEIIIAA
jgi:hypothetical protein